MSDAKFVKKDDKTLTITRVITQDIPVLQVVVTKKAMNEDIAEFQKQTKEMKEKFEDVKKLIGIAKEQKIDVEILERIKGQLEANIDKNESQVVMIEERLEHINSAYDKAVEFGMDVSIPKQVEKNETKNPKGNKETK